MEIINESDRVVTWWCYNSNDKDRLVALKAADVWADGGRTSYDPPSNATGAYYVWITVQGGGGAYNTIPTTSGTLGNATIRRDGTIRVQGSCRYEIVLGPHRDGGPIEIVNESDGDVTWWCFNSNDTFEEVPHRKEDLKKGRRVSYAPPGNATGAYKVLINRLGGHHPYRDWAPDHSAILKRLDTVRPGATLIFRGSCGPYKVTGTGLADGVGYQIE